MSESLTSNIKESKVCDFDRFAAFAVFIRIRFSEGVEKYELANGSN